MSTMTPKEKMLASNLLRNAADHYSNHSCNDFEFPGDWTNEERVQFAHEFYEWNGDLEAQDPSHPSYINLPDFAVMELLAHKLKQP